LVQPCNDKWQQALEGAISVDIMIRLSGIRGRGDLEVGPILIPFNRFRIALKNNETKKEAIPGRDHSPKTAG